MQVTGSWAAWDVVSSPDPTLTQVSCGEVCAGWARDYIEPRNEARL